jgi:hypothetical protein
MITGSAGRRRFQFSVRSLLIVTAVLAVGLVPVVWVTREEQLRRRIFQAREDALRAAVMAERDRAAALDHVAAAQAMRAQALDRNAGRDEAARPSDVPDRIARLQRENAELRAIVERLRREVKRLEAATRIPKEGSGGRGTEPRVPPSGSFRDENRREHHR